jgi:7-carboxy-7-deazaguanine synthase
MTKLHYTEIFRSIQGEGRYMGVPSIFLRMFGCNFRCKNFGRYGKDIVKDSKSSNPEVDEIIKNIEQYKTLKDLPLVETGCDSYSSVYPEFKSFVFKQTPDEIVEQIMALLPHGEWRDEHLVITGGEPLLGWQRCYPDLLMHEKMRNVQEITFETNGTQKLSKDLISALNIWDWEEVTFSVSPKLSCSGESSEDAIKPQIVREYATVGYTYLKFVIATEEDAGEALRTIDIYRDAGFHGPVYLMPVGGTESVYSLNNRRVAELAMQHGLRYSDRLQIPLFRNAWGT